MAGTGAPGGPDVGALSDEAAKLVEALQYWAEQRLGPVAGQFGGSPECAVCPICRVMSVVRGENPEVLRHLADAAGAMAAALAAAFAPSAGEPGGHDDGSARGPGDAPSASGSAGSPGPAGPMAEAG